MQETTALGTAEREGKVGRRGIEAGYLSCVVFTSCSRFLGPKTKNASAAVPVSLCFQLLYSAALLHSCQAALYRAMKEQRRALHSILSLFPWDGLTG